MCLSLWLSGYDGYLFAHHVFQSKKKSAASYKILFYCREGQTDTDTDTNTDSPLFAFSSSTKFWESKQICPLPPTRFRFTDPNSWGFPTMLLLLLLLKLLQQQIILNFIGSQQLPGQCEFFHFLWTQQPHVCVN